MPLGLGRINYEAVRNRRRTAVYVSKYLVKDKVQCRTFGIMRGSVIKEEQVEPSESCASDRNAETYHV